MATKVHVDPRGVAKVLGSQGAQAAANAAAASVKANVEGQGIRVGDEDGGPNEVPIPVVVYDTGGDRAGARVVLAHAAGLAVQAKHGALTKAAGQAGLDVTGSG